MNATPVDVFVNGLTDEEFREYLTAALDRQHALQPGGRAAILRLKRPREKRPLRAMVFEMFGPRETAMPTGELPDFDVTT